MIPTGKNCVLLNSVEEFIETEAWLLLTLLLCQHNQFSSINLIVSYETVQMF